MRWLTLRNGTVNPTSKLLQLVDKDGQVGKDEWSGFSTMNVYK